MLYKFVSIDRIYARLTREGVSFDEEQAVEWTGEALEFIGTNRILEEAIAFTEVHNHQCPVPQFAQEIVQIAKNNAWIPTAACSPAAVIQEAPNIFYQQCSDCGPGLDMGYVVLDGKGTPLVEYGIAYYRPYFDLLGEYYGWSNTAYFRREYSPVTLATNSFFNTVVDSEYNRTLYDNCRNEYRVIQGSTLRFSFSTGFVAIAFKRSIRDIDTGYPMVPDSISHITAIVTYIKKKKNEIDLMNRREGSKELIGYLDEQWQWYCGQASNLDKMPQGIDETQNLYNQRSYMLPNTRSYYGYFGNLARPEIRKWNDSSNRNSHRYITGNL